MLASFATYQGRGVSVVVLGDSYPAISQTVARRDQKTLSQFCEEWAKESKGCGTSFIVEDWLPNDASKNTAVPAEVATKAEAKAKKEAEVRRKRGETEDGDDERLDTAVKLALVCLPLTPILPDNKYINNKMDWITLCCPNRRTMIIYHHMYPHHY
jgi:hypothetical protein